MLVHVVQWLLDHVGEITSGIDPLVEEYQDVDAGLVAERVLHDILNPPLRPLGLGAHRLHHSDPLPASCLPLLVHSMSTEHKGPLQLKANVPHPLTATEYRTVKAAKSP